MNRSGRLKVLWLVSWFPSRVDWLTGDFIERHARSVSLYQDITVLFVVKDKRLRNKQIERERRKVNDYLSVEIVYFGSDSAAGAVLQYLRLHRRLIKEYIHTHGKPDLVHVHVCFRAGLPALYMKYRYGVPYIISEHWSLLSEENFRNLSFFRKHIIKLIYKKAWKSTAVSQALATSVARQTSTCRPLVIPNVFDEELFNGTAGNINGVFKFLHVSQLNAVKNPEQLFQAVEILATLTNRPFEFTVYGPSAIYQHFSVHPAIQFKEEVPQQILAQDFRKHHAFVLYSRYEGLPCVIIEAQASGLPAIVSDIPSMHELMSKQNGVIVPLDHPRLLAEKMLWMMDNIHQYDRESIRQQAIEKFSFTVVGKQFSDLYKNTLLISTPDQCTCS